MPKYTESLQSWIFIGHILVLRNVIKCFIIPICSILWHICRHFSDAIWSYEFIVLDFTKISRSDWSLNDAGTSDVNKDCTCKDKDKDQDNDKDSTHKDQDKDKDLNLVLKESLRTKTRTSLTVTYCKLQLNLQPLSSNNNEHKVKVHNI